MSASTGTRSVGVGKDLFEREGGAARANHGPGRDARDRERGGRAADAVRTRSPERARGVLEPETGDGDENPEDRPEREGTKPSPSDVARPGR